MFCIELKTFNKQQATQKSSFILIFNKTSCQVSATVIWNQRMDVAQRAHKCLIYVSCLYSCTYVLYIPYTLEYLHRVCLWVHNYNHNLL